MTVRALDPESHPVQVEFQNIEMQAPLGLSCEDIQLSVESVGSPETYKFTVTSTGPPDSVVRRSHAQGIVTFAGQAKLAEAERVIRR